MKCLKVMATVFFISILPISPATSEEILIAVGDWPPYLSENLKHNGIMGHLITDVLEAEGYTVRLRFFPWARAYEEASIGKQHSTGVWMHKPEREKDFHYSDPVLNEQFVFFHLRSFGFNWNNLDDLKNITIGGGTEYSYGPEFDAAIQDGKLTVQRVPNKLQNWRKLFAGRILIYPEEKNVGYSSLKQYFHSDKVIQVTHHSKPLLNNLSYMLFPKSSDKSLERMERFNKRLKQFRESGRYESYFESFRNGYYD